MAKIITQRITKKMHTDSGMALVLILLLIGYFSSNVVYFYWAIPALVITMAIPVVIYPFTIIWLGFSSVLGTIVSSLVLSLIFFLLVVPVGMIRRILGKDTLRLTDFKRNTSSVFIQRDHHFSDHDLEKPF